VGQVERAGKLRVIGHVRDAGLCYVELSRHVSLISVLENNIMDEGRRRVLQNGVEVRCASFNFKLLWKTLLIRRVWKV
jgi:hypothetical protein